MTTTPIRPDTTSTLGDEVRAVQELPPPEQRKIIRLKARLSLGRIARDIGVSPSAVWQWERKATPLPVTDNTVKYARRMAELRALLEAA